LAVALQCQEKPAKETPDPRNGSGVLLNRNVDQVEASLRVRHLAEK